MPTGARVVASFRTPPTCRQIVIISARVVTSHRTLFTIGVRPTVNDNDGINSRYVRNTVDKYAATDHNFSPQKVSPSNTHRD